MTDTIEQKALALLKKCVGNAIWKHPITRINRQTNLEHEALCRAIEQHEAFRQEVSDAVTTWWLNPPILFQQFIIPAPKPDPLVEVCNYIGFGHTDTEDMVNDLRAALEARGFEIREKNDDQ